MVLGACAQVVGIEDRRLVESESACSLPKGGTAAIRVMDALPAEVRFDLCWRSSEAAEYPRQGVFAASGDACPKGVGYSQYTVPIKLSPGRYDFKLVEAGRECVSEGVVARDVVLGEQDSTTLLVYGRNRAGAEVAALPDSLPTNNAMDVQLRFVHALTGQGALDAGIAHGTTLPTTIATPIFNDVVWGKAAAESEGTVLQSDDVNERGYMRYPGGEKPPAGFSIAAAPAGSDQAILVAPMELTNGRSYSVFAIGVVGSLDYLPKLWSCEESGNDDGYFARCGQPVPVSFEVLNTNLTDLFTPYIEERTDPAVQAILDHDGDVLCVTEIYPPRIYEKLAAGASATFGHRRFSDDIPKDRISGDLTAWDGTLPKYDEIACTKGSENALQSFMQCGSDATDTDDQPCSRAEGEEHFLDREGLAAEHCLTESCVGPALELLGVKENAAEYYRCYMCGVAHLSSYESFESSAQQCTSASEHPEHMAFGGRTGMAVFSRYPLGDPELVLLPSTNWQHAAMRVPVMLPNGATVDYWCGSIRYPNAEDALPYAGPYGDGQLQFAGTVAEQALQLTRLREVVKKRTRGRGLASILGVTANCGPEAVVDGHVTVDALIADNYQLILKDMTVLVPADYQPQCTFCSGSNGNVLNSMNDRGNIWSTHLLSPNLGQETVRTTEQTFQEERVSVVLSKGGRAKAPISQHFGLRSVVRITQ